MEKLLTLDNDIEASDSSEDEYIPHGNLKNYNVKL